MGIELQWNSRVSGVAAFQSYTAYNRVSGSGHKQNHSGSIGYVAFVLLPDVLSRIFHQLCIIGRVHVRVTTGTT